METKSVQEIFSLVIASGYYLPQIGMCSALFWTNKRKIITDQEYLIATAAIKNYMESLDADSTCMLLMRLFAQKQIPHSPEDMIRFYLNWENNPPSVKRLYYAY